MNKLSLNSVEWKEFIIGDIFDTDIRGKRLKAADRESGNIPLITAGENNNGISSFINNPNHKEYSSAITLDMFANVFYQPSIFKCDDNITILKNAKMNKYSAMFIISQLKKLKVKYSYGNQVRPNRLSRDKILLPIDEKGEPNWEFMENYIKQIMNRQKSQIINYYKSQLSDIAYGRGGDLQNSDIEWRSFRLGKLFNFKKGINKKILLDENIYGVPYIGAKYNNNGIVGFSSNNEYAFKGNSMIFIMTGEGSVGKALYKFENYIPSMNVYVGYNQYLNRYIGQYLTTMINKQSSKYNYGHVRNLSRLTNEKILLPIDEKGEPNWKYMENYVKQKLYSQAKQIINYYEN